MGIGVSFYVRNLVAQEMRERVFTASENGEALAIPQTAAEIANDYPGADFPADDLRNRLFAEAMQADVPVELGRRSSKPH